MATTYNYKYLLWSLSVLTTMCLSWTEGQLPGNIFLDHNRVDWNVGSNINLTCVIEPIKYIGSNSSDMYFEDQNDNRSPKEDITIINETSIVYTIRNASAGSTEYKCKCGAYGVDSKRINVGTPPKNVTHFDCKGYDYVYFSCRFTVPNNSVKVTYSLRYTRDRTNIINTCKLKPDPENRYNSQICNMTSMSEQLDQHTFSQPYIQEGKVFTFFLTGNNSLGELNQTFIVNHADSVKPAKLDVKFHNITTNSVRLTWYWNRDVFYKEKGVVFSLKIRPEGRANWTTTFLNAELQKSTYMSDIMNLEYSFIRYDVQIRAKVKTAIDDETMWSEPFIGSFKTLPKAPDNAPDTDVGSFYLTNTDIHLYWRGLNNYSFNGEHFKYNIDVIKNGLLTKIKRSTDSNVTEKYTYQEHVEYVFNLTSVNSNGASPNSNLIRVPQKKRDGPKQIYKVLLDTGSMRQYTLSWSPPEHSSGLLDYTVFWCSAVLEIHNQCRESIDFQHFDKNTTSYTHVHATPLNFAVSANYENSSSGMKWAMCTAHENSDLNKLDFEVTLNSTFIEVQWSTECIYIPIITYYKLSYCEINTESNGGVCYPPINITQNNNAFTLKGLRPYTKYNITMLMHSKNKDGPVSNPKVITTLSEAPSPPRNLNASHVTNNSLVLIWHPPEHFNGLLTSYSIHFNKEMMTVTNLTTNEAGVISFKLAGLKSFWNYNIYVTARTNKDSLASNIVNITTDVGKPSEPRNASSDPFQWEPPLTPAGNVDFYEIRSFLQKSKRVIWTRVLTPKCKFECHDGFYSKIQIRAVNVRSVKKRIQLPKLNTSTELCVSKSTDDNLEAFNDPNEYELFHSDWIEVPQPTCNSGTDSGSKKTIIAFTSLTTAIFLMSIGFFAYKKVNQMKDISAKLPPGLDDMNTTTIEDMNITIAKSTESLFPDKESESLLAIERSFDKRHDFTNIYDASSDIVKDDQSTRSVDSVEMNDVSNSSYSSSPDDNHGSNLSEQIQSTIPTGNGYIKPMQLNSGYVQASQFQNIPETSFSGYVTLDNMGKPIQNNPDPRPSTENYKMNSKDDQHVGNMHDHISGYVTHKQLSDFGQQNNHLRPY